DHERVHRRPRPEHPCEHLVADQAGDPRDEGGAAEYRGRAQQPAAPGRRRRGTGIGRAQAAAPTATAVLTQVTESPIISGSLVKAAGSFPAARATTRLASTFPTPTPDAAAARVPPTQVSRIPPWPTSSLPRSAPSRQSCATSATPASARSSAPP